MAEEQVANERVVDENGVTIDQVTSYKQILIIGDGEEYDITLPPDPPPALVVQSLVYCDRAFQFWSEEVRRLEKEVNLATAQYKYNEAILKDKIATDYIDIKTNGGKVTEKVAESQAEQNHKMDRDLLSQEGFHLAQKKADVIAIERTLAHLRHTMTTLCSINKSIELQWVSTANVNNSGNRINRKRRQHERKHEEPLF